MEQASQSSSSNITHFQPPIQNADRSVTQIMFTPPLNAIPHNKQDDPEVNFNQSLSTYEKQRNNPSIPNDNISEDSMILPILNDDDGMFERKHSPILTRFPSDILPLTQPMETNVEDNIHKLRLRLIDSEFKHQHGSKDDHMKRTHKELSLSFSIPTESYAHNVQPPYESVHQQVTPKIMSRQTSLSILSASTPPPLSGSSRARKGMENGPQNYPDIEHDFEIQRLQDSFDKRHRSTQQLPVSNYPYDSRLYLQPLNEEQLYTSSNMDDLIDSMARRHLASRRHNTSFDRQRRSNGFHSPYIEPLNSGQTTHRSQQRNDDIIYTNMSSRNPTDRDFIRTHSNGYDQMFRAPVDHHNRIQLASNDMDNDDSIHENPYIKLPPISSRHDSHPQSPLTRNETKHDSHTLPLISSEHLIKLPSDIFLSSKIEPRNSLQLTRKTKQRSKSKDAHSETDQSDGETDVSQDNHHKKNSKNGHHGFFTEPDVQQKKKTKYRRNLFHKAAVGIFFIIILKRRAIKTRSHRPIQSPRAAIHKIRLQEILVALHRVYLEPDGPIYNALIQSITHSVSLQHALNRSSKNYLEAIKAIGNALKHIISEITQFMPKDGVLGTEKSSALSALLQDGNPFPDNYFWQCEREHLEFDNLKLINITKQRAILLLIGIFIFRALVTTLLIKPIKYRLILGQLTPSQSASLKVLSSVMLYLGRRTAGPNSQILTLPDEWKLSLYSDADIEPIIQHSEIKSIIGTCEESLRMWCEEYIRRIDASFDKALRT